MAERGAASGTVLRALKAMHAGRRAFYPTHYPPLDSWPAAGSGQAALSAWRAAVKKEGRSFRAGVYAHVPFCPAKCGFCFIPVSVPRADAVRRYLDALRKEAAILSPVFSRSRFRALYVGGGTPSMLSAAELDEFLSVIQGSFRFAPGSPFSIETAPQFLDVEKLALLADRGVTWLSMGMQSLDQRVVDASGRSQRNSGMKDIFLLARKSGIPHINVDLLIGLPGQSPAGLLADVERLAAWGPDEIHLNVYKPPYGVKDPRRKRLDVLLQEKGMDILARRGYSRLDGDSAVLSPGGGNQSSSVDFYLSHHLLGLGPVSISHVRGRARYENSPSFPAYARALERERLPVSRLTRLTLMDEMRHFVLAGIERNGAVRDREFRSRFGRALETVFSPALRRLTAEGVLTGTGDGFVFSGRPDSVPAVYAAFCPPDVLRRAARKAS